jgi:hypothetical protein
MSALWIFFMHTGQNIFIARSLFWPNIFKGGTLTSAYIFRKEQRGVAQPTRQKQHASPFRIFVDRAEEKFSHFFFPDDRRDAER